jgi:2-polyprenyl-3-methyl-5-hydroxy-6-metoxy-1,4-benzoquinol methylase
MDCRCSAVDDRFLECLPYFQESIAEVDTACEVWKHQSMEEKCASLLSKAGSYEPEPVGSDLRGEIERLRAQVELSWNAERRRLAGLGVRDGMRIVELGCGAGFFTHALARWMPHSTITAIDIDRRMLSAAAECFEKDDCRSRVQLRLASADATQLATDSFDLVISRYLMQHVADPDEISSEAYRILRPGGMHVIIDVDDGMWGIVAPAIEEFRQWHGRRARRQALLCGDRFVGHRLGRILRATGYCDVTLDVFAYDSDELGMAAFDRQLTPDQFLPLLEDNKMSPEEYLESVFLYRKFTDTPGCFVMMIGFIARGVKP